MSNVKTPEQLADMTVAGWKAGVIANLDLGDIALVDQTSSEYVTDLETRIRA